MYVRREQELSDSTMHFFFKLNTSWKFGKKNLTMGTQFLSRIIYFVNLGDIYHFSYLDCISEE